MSVSPPRDPIAIREPMRRTAAHRVVRVAAAIVLATACRGQDPVTPEGAANRILWSAPLPGYVEGESAATTDAVYAATDSGLAALDRVTGQRRWFTPVAGLSGSKRVLVRGERVLTAGVGAVHAHLASTGVLLWERAFDVNTASPDFSDLDADQGALYVGLRDGRALALALSDGRVLWEAQIATPEWTFKGLIGGSTLSGDTVYVTATRYLSQNAFEEAAVIVALDRATGREFWRYQATGFDTSISHAAVVAGANLVFSEAYHGAVIAVDRVTGVERWRQPTYGFIFGAPAVRGDTAFVVTAAARAYAIDAATGRTLWTADLSAGATSGGLCASELFVGNFHVEVLAAGSGARVGLAFEGSSDEIVTSLVKTVDAVAYVGTNKRLLAFRCR